MEVSDMKSLTYTLPWPPSVNHYWRRVLIGGKPRTLLSKEGREFKQTAVLQYHVMPDGDTVDAAKAPQRILWVK